MLGGKREKPDVHRMLELLFRTTPVVQLRPSIYELVFEKFRQFSEVQLPQCNGRSFSAYSMQRWREAQVSALILASPQQFDFFRIASERFWEKHEGSESVLVRSGRSVSRKGTHDMIRLCRSRYDSEAPDPVARVRFRRVYWDLEDRKKQAAEVQSGARSLSCCSEAAVRSEERILGTRDGARPAVVGVLPG